MTKMNENTEFYEDDEPIEKILTIFEHNDKRLTGSADAPPADEPDEVICDP